MGKHKSSGPINTGPTYKNIGLLILDNKGNKVTNAEAYINGNKLISDQPGGFATVVETWNKSVGLVVRAPGFIEYSQELILPPNEGKNFDITLTPVVVAPVIKRATPLTIQGNRFNKRIKGRDAFTALKIFINDGPNALRPYFAECRKYNRNMLRVFCTLFDWYHGDLDPRTIPLFANYLRDFIEFCISEGFNLELDALTGDQFKGTPFDKQFVKLVSDICAEYKDYVLFKIGNELWRWYSVDELKDLASVVNKNSTWAVTSPKMEGNDDPLTTYILPLPENKAVFFHGKYITIHSIRGDEQARRSKDIDDIQNDYGVPCYMNEPFGAGSEAGRTNEPRQYIEYSATASLFGGACFHSDRSIFCQTLDGNELACLEAFSQGQELISEEFVNGHYTRYGSRKWNDWHEDCPIGESAEPLLRAYFKILGPKAIGVLVRQTDGTPKDINPDWRNGWKLAGNIGPVYLLEQ